ncbi:MAG: hypothetical protein K6G01_00275 [Eubacterium sp.]|nr:hypothetical protein [Eubacterium sp.]
MKKTYVTPKMEIELFMPNQAVSTCTVNSSTSWAFDCMKGPNVDYASNIVASSLSNDCGTNVGYAAGKLTAKYRSGSSHSNHNSSIASWTSETTGSGWNKKKYLVVTYSSGDGLLYAEADNNGHNTCAGNWTSKDNYIVNEGASHMHAMVAPVLNSTSVNASW